MQVTLNAGSSRTIHGDRVFLCVGSRASVPFVPGLAEAEPMTHIEALNLERLPRHLIIIGGGYVGLEFAQSHASPRQPRHDHPARTATT